MSLSAGERLALCMWHFVAHWETNFSHHVKPDLAVLFASKTMEKYLLRCYELTSHRDSYVHEALNGLVYSRVESDDWQADFDIHFDSTHPIFAVTRCGNNNGKAAVLLKNLSGPHSFGGIVNVAAYSAMGEKLGQESFRVLIPPGSSKALSLATETHVTSLVVSIDRSRSSDAGKFEVFAFE